MGRRKLPRSNLYLLECMKAVMDAYDQHCMPERFQVEAGRMEQVTHNIYAEN